MELQMRPRSCQIRFAAALAGGVLAALLAPGMAQAAECGASFQQSIDGSTFTFPGFTIGMASAIGSAVTTTDAALQAQGSSAFVVAAPTKAQDQQAGGVWVRAVGGNFLTSVPVTGSSSLSPSGTPPTAVTSIDCQSRVRQGFGGVQVGADVANLNFGGSGGTLHVGLTSGLVETSAVTNSSSTNLDFQVPFFGLYSSLTYGNSHGTFSADGQIRGDFFQGSLSDNQNSVFGQKVNARGFTVSGNVAYQYNLYNLPGHWFIEPSTGVNWSRTFVDPVNLSSTNMLTRTGFIVPFPVLNLSRVLVQDFDNLTGRASVRVGTRIDAGQLIFQPFATASVLHEFADPIVSRVSTLDVAPDSSFALQTGLFSTARIGTYGQFGLGVAVLTADSGWTSFVRGDYRVGSRFNGWSVAGGARYSFNPEVGVTREGRSAEPARALPAPAPYDWTGFFLGASAPGALWGDTNWSSGNTRGGGEAKVAGLLAGGGGGYNYQLGPLVIGGLAEWDWSNARGGNSFSCRGDFGGFPFNGVNSLSSFGCDARLNSIFTATARVGYAFDRLLIYGQGGLAAGDISAKTVTTVTTLQVIPTLSVVSIPTTASASKTSVGWTVGAGVEYGLTQNISAKAEYLYFDLGSDTYNLGVPVAINRTGNIGRVGLNYRFNLM
jgi:opacity protein-like surface antigen